MHFSRRLFSIYGERRFFNKSLNISPEVCRALENGQPVVALESTIITHGMPYPENIRTAIDVENIVKEQGCVPATIGVVNGIVRVGFDNDSLTKLANNSQAIKISRRDFPYVLSNKLSGGTTVSGTLMIAKMIGIRVFVTGGIGGVHRDVESSMDVSADLYEISRSNAMVVSSGVKSILDIGKTLEVLETLGVCVASYGPTKKFPAFYSMDSGFDAICNVETPDEAAQLLCSALELGANSGILLGVPVPEKYSIPADEMEKHISEGLKLASKNSIKGKDTTPFLLSALSNITKEKSLETNVALIKNNALVGSGIAVALGKKLNLSKINQTRLFSSSPNLGCLKNRNSGHERCPVIIGCSMVDCTVKATENIQMDGRTISGRVHQTAGGVARNIADAMGRLTEQNQPILISAVGNDQIGEILKQSLAHTITDGIITSEIERSGSCFVFLDKRGECQIFVADMDINKLITNSVIDAWLNTIRKSPMVILDCNINNETLEYTLEICKMHNVSTWIEPTDLSKAYKPFVLDFELAPDYISPNFSELQVIAETLTGTKSPSIDIPNCSCEIVVKEAKRLCQIVNEYVPNIVATLGKYGLIVAKKISTNEESVCTHYKSPFVQRIETTSGAGDCLAAAYIVALLNGCNEQQCVSYGISAALQALRSKCTVPQDIQFERLEQLYDEDFRIG